jgi:hypothetical protein
MDKDNARKEKSNRREAGQNILTPRTATPNRSGSVRVDTPAQRVLPSPTPASMRSRRSRRCRKAIPTRPGPPGPCSVSRSESQVRMLDGELIGKNMCCTYVRMSGTRERNHMNDVNL